MTREARQISDRESLLRRIDEMESVVASLEAELDHCSRLATLGVLAGMIAHEFNNLLTPIMSYSMLALADLGDADLVHKALQKNVEGSERLTRISSAILGFLSDTNEPLTSNLAKVLEDSMECMVYRPGKVGVRLVISIPSDFVVQMRPTCLQQVFINLLNNAISAMKGKGGEIRMTATADPSGKAEILIADTGCGIPEEIVDRVFEPLVSWPASQGQDRQDNDERSTGHGLGLAICRRLVEDAGGTINVQTNNGQGTIFTISLALVTTDVERKSA